MALMTSNTFFWVAALGLAITALASLGTRVIYEVAWHELKDVCRRHNRRPLFDTIHDNHEDVALGLETVRIVGASFMLVGLAGWLVTVSGDWPTSNWDWAAVILLTFFTLLAALVWIPSALARIWAHDFLFRGWHIFWAASQIVLPFAVVTNTLEAILRRMTDEGKPPSEEEAFEDEVMAIVTEGQHDGHLEADARQMIAGVMELDDSNAADIMTPRSEVDAVDAELTIAEAAAFANECGRTRIPVYEKDFDKIVGVLYAKDLLKELARNGDDNAKDRKVIELMRPHWSVPRTRPLDELLKDFLRNRIHLAIVLDEFNSVAGIVTIEDVLEEIVGEIVDETDEEEIGEIRRLDEHKAEISGRAHLADINEQLGLELPEPEDFDTIGGLIVHRLGHIPTAGESVDCDSVQLTVLSASKRKVEEVLLVSEEGIASKEPTSELNSASENGAPNRSGHV